MPGPMPLNASALSLLGAVLGLPDGGEEGRGQDALWEINPPPQQSGWLRLQGLGQGWKELRPANIYHSRALAKALTTPHLNPQTEAPGPDQPMPLLLPPAPGRRGKRPSPGGPSPGSPSKMQSKPKQTKTKQVFNRKNKGNCGKMWHLAMPSPQLCCPLPGLAEACPHPHAHLVQLSPLWA